ncbi:MAG: hypothetical protein JKY56_16905 [Kofleriaceae bacterium]|nr:hypothetical protein [Kofleriaceae bacterium]
MSHCPQRRFYTCPDSATELYSARFTGMHDSEQVPRTALAMSEDSWQDGAIGKGSLHGRVPEDRVEAVMEIHTEAQYSEWLVQEGVPTAHLQAHEFARQLFERNGGLTRAAMQDYLYREEAQSGDPARLRNLAAAAKFIVKFQSEKIKNDELELDLARPTVKQDGVREQEHKLPLLDLDLDTAPLSTVPVDRASVDRASVGRASADRARLPLTASQNNTYCDCTAGPEPTLVTSGLFLAGPVAFFGFIALRLYAGKSFAIMAQWGGAAVLALVALLLLRMRCEICDTTLDNDTLDSGSKKQLLGTRVLLICLLVVTGYFAKAKHSVWAEENRLASLSDQEWEEEWEREARKDAEEDVGHTLSDSEYEDYRREEEAMEIEELEEFIGRPLTQEELEEEGFGDY